MDMFSQGRYQKKKLQKLPLDPKTMKNEGFTPQIMGYKCYNH